MKRTGMMHRVLALLLVVVMTVQLLPLGVFAAFGDLQGAETGVDLSTLQQDDAINWPIKVYDYLSDGMLFEWMDTNTSTGTDASSTTITTGHTSDTGAVTPYGGGYKNPVTALGSDYTYGTSSSWSSSSYGTYYYWQKSSFGKNYTVTQKAAVDYVSPLYMRITNNSSYSGTSYWNLNLSYFSSDQSTTGSMRYMVMVYRGSGLTDNIFRISASGTTGGSPWIYKWYSFEDSSEWTYKIIDMSELGTSSVIQYTWLTCSDSNKSSGFLDSGDTLDITHIGYFSTQEEAENYGTEAVKFDNKPGEYLHHSATTTYTHSYVTPVSRGSYLDHVFSLNNYWKNEGTAPEMFDGTTASSKTWYGMDFTTHSTANGWKTNAYTSDTFWTWSNGATVSVKNTVNNVTKTESFAMSSIGVEQKTQSNGAQYVTLTTSGPSKILLSKFREDLQATNECYIPTKNGVYYMVLVYRPNGLTSSDPFGLWANGYLEESAAEDYSSAGIWKHAGLTKESDWTEADNVKKLYFSDTEGWQYRIIPISVTIGEEDTNMSSIDRIANVGLYLPDMSDGASLDVAYVSYFKYSEHETAVDFATKAVNYMNADPIVTQDKNESYTYGSSRVWYGGGNKSFGMLYSSGGGQYLVSGNSGGESSSTNLYNYGYDFDTWMIGYRTNAVSSNAFNTARYNLVYNPTTDQYDKVKYTAKYTGTTSGYANLDFISDASGTTNNIFFIAATEDDETWGSNDGDDTNGHDFNTSNMPFDGYQILETITSGVMTAGLLEGSLQTVTVEGKTYRVPVYRQETVEYIAYNLLNGLRVPMRDSSGNYNTRYIKGTESTKYGGVDLNGDGEIGWIDYDGDSRSGHYDDDGTWIAATELNEESVDLATALRHELGLTPRMGNSVNVMAGSSGVLADQTNSLQLMGSYDETVAKSRMLYGEFSDCRNAIETAMDAAYYLLNNIFISNSYNQEQDDYDYLTLSSATVNALGHSGDAYVFDAGFTTGSTASAGVAFTDDGTNKSAIVYSAYGTDGGTGTISMSGVTGKTHFDYSKSDTSSWTTRFPFLPITDAEGDFAGQTQSYYFLDDAQRVYTEGSNSYKDRNFNYVIASNGEFVYYEEDDLFFEFEGDDDVYLFINGELVLDIGGAHSITSVYIDVNDYVTAAASALSVLEKYGYHKDMSITQFDEWISADSIAYLNSDLESTGETVTNPYSADQKATFKRQHRLNLSDGQICQFDFYYMERHGWGANMRIVTNMHITDPALNVEKSAYQFGEEIEYGGVIDPTSSVEYNFTLTNTGNTKLYNLTWRDDVLGITMDPTNGLTVDSTKNGIYVLNANGGYLQAKDLTAVVCGTDANGNYSEFRVTFDEVEGDGGQTALKQFLKKLESNDGTASGFDDAEVTNAGSGLWVGASVQFCGMYYMLTPEQTDAGMVDNTVYLTATTRIDSTTVGNRTLRSDATHRLYTNGFPIHYQWAGHSIFMNLEHLLEQAKIEAERDGSQLSLYQSFFQNVTLSNLLSAPCDKFGRVGGDYSAFLTEYTRDSNYSGYYINYEEPGVHTFYLLLYMKSGKDDEGNTTNFAGKTVNASDIGEGYYAILRSQVYVADVEDSVYVLDYGLSTESLDTDGILFENDYLFGPYGTIRAKLMGISGGVFDEETQELIFNEPSYIDPTQNEDPTIHGINFDTVDGNRVYGPNGFYNVNIAIPETGKEIAYDSNKGQYTLTGVGTVKINVELPTTTEEDDPWATPYLYYWYDDGTTGPVWPGTPLQSLGAGKYEIDIPADVPNVIVNNGSAAVKTEDLKITPGLESTITVSTETTTDDQGTVYQNAVVETIVEEVTMHVKVPADWGTVYLYYWYDNGESATYPGVELTETDDDGYYTISIPGDVTNLLINNGADKKTGDLTVYAGKEVWFELSDTASSSVTDDGGTTVSYYDAVIKYTLSEGFVVHASVPQSWKDTVYLYYWHVGMTDDEMTWPGVPMTKGDAGWYTYDGLVPADVTMLIINDGGNGKQTVDLTVTPGLETWVMVDNKTVAEGDNAGKYTATVAYGSESSSTGLTFTPKSFMDEENCMWMAITVHSTSATPSAVGPGIDIHNEVQMYKKITVLPATVVYYEDTFVSDGDYSGIEYIADDTTEGNSFVHHGNGSGRLTQNVDPDMPYGQDPAYQDDRNNLYSGQSMTAVLIKDTDKFATFTFKGTGFELIGRTNAFDSATTVARVFKAEDYKEGILDEYSAAAKEYQVYIGVKTTYENAVAAYNDVQSKYDAAVTAYDKALAAYENVDSDATTYEYRYEEYLLAVELYEDTIRPYKNAMTAYENAVTAFKSYHNISDSSSSSEAVAPETVAQPGELVSYVAPSAPEALLGSAYAEVEQPENPVIRNVPVITQFDHGSDGGKETANQVPTLRVTDLEWGEYVVELSGIPAYTFDENYNLTGIADSYVYIDGLRIFQPMGATNDAYSDEENGAVVEELRNLILGGKVGVGTLSGDGLQLSTGTVTWTENLPDNDFYLGNYETYEGIVVGSADDYLLQGPNNEVYMEGNAANSALVFYVTEADDSDVHELQIAVRGLDYSKFYGAGSSAIDAQLQYGILLEDGSYAWKNLARVVSGTEQYYTIPYEECPVDLQGRYQIAVRAVNIESNRNALVSYTSLKRNGLEVVSVEGLGETTVMYYENGMLIKPEYELVIVNASFGIVDIVPFSGTELTMELERDWSYVYIRSTINGETYDFYAHEDPGQVTSATLWRYDDNYGDYSKWTFDIAKGDAEEITFKIKQTVANKLELSYCKHTWDDGLVAEEADCCNTGVMAYTCTACGHMKQEIIETNSKHTYSNGVCVRCGVAEPDYYLIGYINNANYGCEGDWENSGEYKFTDGKLVATFNENSYVFIKQGADSSSFVWYMFDGYCSAKSGTLYNTANGLADPNKMFVPGGVEVTFTLVENGDGSLTLSYSVPCEHTWDAGTIILAPTCTAEGEKEYYCSKCGEVRTEVLETIEHSYKDGYCTACGDVQMRKLYLLFTEEWEDAYAYAWTEATEETDKEEYLGSWPGTQMTILDLETAVVQVPVTAKKIIFHNGSGTQTADLDIPTDGRDMYNFYKNEWVIKSQVVDYYLIGYINGADYGCNDDYANLGDYKFVNGELVATFSQDSYVFVKTTGNLNWYMTSAYVDDCKDPVTLLNTSAGASEKIRVPGNTELTFTLVVNSDDTLTLTVHAWAESSCQAATCEEDGYVTYTCSLCGEEKTTVLTATGHNYVDGVCQNASCTTLKTQRVYYKNSAGWTTVNIYAWTTADSVTTLYTDAWPGSAMSYDADLELYYYDLPVNAVAVIFNDGSNQTGNLTAPQESSDARVYYDYAKAWGTIDNPPEVPEETEAQMIYLVPNSNWTADGARFAAYFFGGTSATTWVDMTDADGDGTYECAIPGGDYATVIFCRMNGSTTDNNWDNKWNQTGNLTLPTDGTNRCTINDGEWDCGQNVTWDTYAVAASLSLRSAAMVTALSAAAAEETAVSAVPDMYVNSYDGDSVNLYSVNRQMTSNIIYGEMDLFEPGSEQPEDSTDAQVDISGVMLQLSDDISVIFKAEVPADASDVHMVFSFNGAQTTVTDYTVDANGKCTFIFTGVNPQLMGDGITATVYATVDGAVISDTKADYSVRTYCESVLQKDLSDEMRALISDLLVYGAAAQQYTGYKTDALVTDGLELNNSTFPGLDSSFDRYQISGEKNDIHDVSSISLELSNKVAMKFGFVLDDPELYTYEVTISGETLTYTADALTYDAETGKYYLTFSDIYATEFDEVVTVEVKQNGEVVSRTMEYTVNTYIYARQNTDDAALREMLHAIFNYGRSAEAFRDAQN